MQIKRQIHRSKGTPLVSLNRFSLYRVRKLPGINSPTSGNNISPRTSRPQPETLFSAKLPSNSLCPAESRPTCIRIYILHFPASQTTVHSADFTRAPDAESGQAVFVRQRIIKCEYLIS